jgi:hypothetical protein
MHSDFIVFADESGDHSLAKINPDYPVFVLSFCIFRKTDYVESVCPLLQRFKLRWWAHDGVVLHSMRMRRQEVPFVFLKTLDKRERFNGRSDGYVGALSLYYHRSGYRQDASA